MTRFYFSVAAGISIVFGASLAVATSFVTRPMGDVIDEAPVIIRGKALDSHADWSQPSDPGKKIYTYTDVQIEEVIKGDVSPKTIQVREIGGEKDGVTLEVPGSAHFKHGDDVVLMLAKQASDRSYPLLGLSTGKYTVSRDSSGNEVLIGASSHDPYPGSHPQVQNDTSGMKKWSLNDLRRWAQRPGRPEALPSGNEKTQENQSVQPDSSTRQSPGGPTASPLLYSSSEAETRAPVTDNVKAEKSSIREIVLGVVVLIILIGMMIRRRK